MVSINPEICSPKTHIFISHPSQSICVSVSTHACLCDCVCFCAHMWMCVCHSVWCISVRDQIRRKALTHPWGLSSWLSGLALCRFRFKTTAYNRHALDLSNQLCSCLRCSTRLNGACTCLEYSMSVLNYNMCMMGPWGALYQRQSSVLLPQLAPLLISGPCKRKSITATYLPHPGQCIFSEESFSVAEIA